LAHKLAILLDKTRPPGRNGYQDFERGCGLEVYEVKTGITWEGPWLGYEVDFMVFFFFNLGFLKEKLLVN